VNQTVDFRLQTSNCLAVVWCLESKVWRLNRVRSCNDAEPARNSPKDQVHHQYGPDHQGDADGGGLQDEKNPGGPPWPCVPSCG